MKTLRSRSVVGGVILTLTGCLSTNPVETDEADPPSGSSTIATSGGGVTTSSAAGGQGAGSSSTSGSGGGGATVGATSSSGTGAGGGDAPSDAYFPAGSWFYQDISNAPLAADSSTVTQWLQNNGGWGTGQMRIDFSIEVLKADASTPYETFETTGDFFSPDCDHVPVPVPAGGALEGEDGYECENDGDCHLIVRDDANGRLYEMWRANITGGAFYGGCLAAWDMSRLYGPEGRGEQCSSSDGAGFPVAPLLFTADEVAAGEIKHAIRFILPNARMRDGVYIRPATHAGAPSGPAQAPVYGSRWRLRADYPVDSLPSDGAKVVANAMKKYGMALADGGNIALTAQSDRSTAAKWEDHLGTYDLSDLQPTDFEVIDTGNPISLTYDCVRTPY
jgi:serine/threonine-protein kinase